MSFLRKVTSKYRIFSLHPDTAEGTLFFKATESKPYIDIWRVENEKGFGPYTEDAGDWNQEHEDENHPDALTDRGFALDKFNENPLVTNFNGWASVDDQLRFGFLSKKQLTDWFSERELIDLKKNGYNIVQKKAEIVWKGHKQAIYKPYVE